MSRTLRRPMFRGGGKIESRGTGITSGLDDRPGYAEAGSVMDQTKTEAEKLIDLQKEMGIFSDPEKPATTFGLTRPELLKLAQRSFEFASKGGDETLGQKLTGSVSDALGDISTSMLARKEKFKEQQREQDLVRAGLIEKAYGTVSDRDTLKKTLAAEKEIEEMKAKSDAAKGGDTVFENKIKLLEMDYNRAIENAGDDEEKKKQLTKEYYAKRDKIITDSGVTDYQGLLVENLLQDDTIRKRIGTEVRKQLEQEADEFPPGSEAYLDEYTKRLYEAGLNIVQQYGYKEGGRVGKANGGMTTAMNTNDQMTLKQPEQTPTGLSYDLVRARIPESVGDDIVRLIVMSPVALEDFADIQTQIDVDNFNQKYNVNLTLPQSGV